MHLTLLTQPCMLLVAAHWLLLMHSSKHMVAEEVMSSYLHQGAKSLKVQC